MEIGCPAIVIWLLFGIAAAMAAARKGRNPAGWFFLGILLGPFGLLFALLSGKVEPPVDATSGTRKCPACAERVLRDAVKCRFCGEQLPPIRFSLVRSTTLRAGGGRTRLTATVHTLHASRPRLASNDCDCVSQTSGPLNSGTAWAYRPGMSRLIKILPPNPRLYL